MFILLAAVAAITTAPQTGPAHPPLSPALGQPSESVGPCSNMAVDPAQPRPTRSDDPSGASPHRTVMADSAPSGVRCGLATPVGPLGQGPATVVGPMGMSSAPDDGEPSPAAPRGRSDGARQSSERPH